MAKRSRGDDVEEKNGGDVDEDFLVSFVNRGGGDENQEDKPALSELRSLAQTIAIALNRTPSDEVRIVELLRDLNLRVRLMEFKFPADLLLRIASFGDRKLFNTVAGLNKEIHEQSLQMTPRWPTVSISNDFVPAYFCFAQDSKNFCVLDLKTVFREATSDDESASSTNTNSESEIEAKMNLLRCNVRAGPKYTREATLIGEGLDQIDRPIEGTWINKNCTKFAFSCRFMNTIKVCDIETMQCRDLYGPNEQEMILQYFVTPKQNFIIAVSTFGANDLAPMDICLFNLQTNEILFTLQGLDGNTLPYYEACGGAHLVTDEYMLWCNYDGVLRILNFNGLPEIMELTVPEDIDIRDRMFPSPTDAHVFAAFYLEEEAEDDEHSLAVLKLSSTKAHGDDVLDDLQLVAQVRLLVPPNDPDVFEWFPDGERLAYCTGNQSIHLVQLRKIDRLEADAGEFSIEETVEAIQGNGPSQLVAKANDVISTFCAKYGHEEVGIAFNIAPDGKTIALNVFVTGRKSFLHFVTVA
jgi:hypothetical protein